MDSARREESEKSLDRARSAILARVNRVEIKVFGYIRWPLPFFRFSTQKAAFSFGLNTFLFFCCLHSFQNDHKNLLHKNKGSSGNGTDVRSSKMTQWLEYTFFHSLFYGWIKNWACRTTNRHWEKKKRNVRRKTFSSPFLKFEITIILFSPFTVIGERGIELRPVLQLSYIFVRFSPGFR